MTRKLDTLIEGLVFPEAPRWHAGRLWFSDMHAHRVMTVDAEGRSKEIVEVPNRPSGLGFLDDGSLLIVSMTDRRLLRLRNGVLETAADLTTLFAGEANDMVVDARGRAYIGNFGFDFAAGEAPQPTNLVLVSENGEARSVADDLFFPNGSVITPDGDTLIVAETYRQQLTAFSILPDGSLSDRRVFAELGGLSPDGICLDAEGGVWVSSFQTDEYVRVREAGKITERIPVPGRRAVACMLGGADRRTLFMLSAETTIEELRQGRSVGRIEVTQVEVPGAGLP